ncbi:MAG: hypothetical protein H8E17_14345 [Deltaproteobacteria bacterium]|nr:hypothetical protein [Deltaproteobacteria bacterium]
MTAFEIKSRFQQPGVLSDSDFRQKITEWVLEMQMGPCQFKMSAGSDATIFTTCFALFILDLFGQTGRFTQSQKAEWVDFINGFQNKESGYFEPAVHYRDPEWDNYQLTCFCLSALGILGGSPAVPLSFLEQWPGPEDVRKYLHERGCHVGKPGSGNSAMFLAIFLTYEYERTHQSHFLEKMDAWFDFHDTHQNRSGFWGRGRACHSLPALQNALHQFVIYFYWQRKVGQLNRIIDVSLVCQDRDGFFAPNPGGEPCYDYDAIHVLAVAHRLTDYRKNDIEACLNKAQCGILRSFNDDGGFCHSTHKWTSCCDFMSHIPVFFSGKSPYLWYYRIRRSLADLIKRRHNIYEGWTQESRTHGESNLWGTWFRCLALAEIERTLTPDFSEEMIPWRFHKTIGLGYF